MKFATLATALLTVVLTACGGGDIEPQASVQAPLTHLSILSEGMRSQVPATNPGVTVARAFQALTGKALGAASYANAVAQVGSSNGFEWANAQAASLSGLSDSAFAARILGNMSISPTTLLPTPAFGTAQQEYDSLQRALAEYLSAFAPKGVGRGTVVLQLASIIAGLEVDNTFGVYSAAAKAFNQQVAANITYSLNPANIMDAVVTPTKFTELTKADVLACPTIFGSRDESLMSCFSGKQMTGTVVPTGDRCVLSFEDNKISITSPKYSASLTGPYGLKGLAFSYSKYYSVSPSLELLMMDVDVVGIAGTFKFGYETGHSSAPAPYVTLSVTQATPGVPVGSLTCNFSVL